MGRLFGKQLRATVWFPVVHPLKKRSVFRKVLVRTDLTELCSPRRWANHASRYSKIKSYRLLEERPMNTRHILDVFCETSRARGGGRTLLGAQHTITGLLGIKITTTMLKLTIVSACAEAGTITERDSCILALCSLNVSEVLLGKVGGLLLRPDACSVL
ncbi:hypothetical protein GMOD_00002608 [Pyrenophora seminiperda CCB06]|uniref:Uncharacterized protein n=1 Tax=Pyrenophora seminiperda CCB06 TaxID=1302712 RepID=A0A3M7M2S0_9PLEO|nr:hypothetical protein GMOD_00002608 [Pyrenophora seminiperda CCB06]